MSDNRFRFSGLDELRSALRALPKELGDRGNDIVERLAKSAFDEIVNGYPEPSATPDGTGNLRKGMGITYGRSALGGRATIINRAKHAYVYENGTQVRRVSSIPSHPTGNFGLGRGSMPPAHVFVPVIIRTRRAMEDGLAELVRGHGLTVTGA